MESRTLGAAIFSKRQSFLSAVFVLICAHCQWLAQVNFQIQMTPLGFNHSLGPNATWPAQQNHFCICNGSATNIQNNISLSSPFFGVNYFSILSGGNHFCCDGLVPDHRKHVFFSVANLAYGHFVFNGVAPLWDKLRGERQLLGTVTHDKESPLVLHLIAGKQNDSMLEQPYLREYLELFGGEVHLYSRESYLEQRFLLVNRPILGLANITLDHYNDASSSQLWRDFRDFLINGFPQLRYRYQPRNNKILRRITIIQRKENRKFRKLNATIVDMQRLLQNETEWSFTIQVVEFENMSAVDQAGVMSQTDILIGADGTGIMNGIYLPGNYSCVIAVLPFGARQLIPEKGKNFATLFAKLGMRYISLESSALRRKSLQIYRLAKSKATPLERWFMLKQNLNISAQQLVSAIQSCVG